MSIFKRSGGIEWFVAPSSKKAQVNRIAKKLKGRKADVEVKHGKKRSVLKIWH